MVKKREGNFPDPVDIRILKLLQADSQISYTEMSKTLRMTPAAIHKRIKRLKSAGIIDRFTVLLDAQKLGKKLKAFVGISTAPGSCREVIGVLENRPEILEIHEIAGEHDLFVKIVTEDTLTLNRILHEIDSIPGVSTTRTLIVLKTEKETPNLPV